MNVITVRDEALRRNEIMPAGSLSRLFRRVGVLAMAAGVALSAGAPARAAQQAPRIDSFGPYALGMTLDQAKAAHKAGKPAACGDIAPDRQCLLLDAAVFEEPARLFAVLDKAGAKVERIVAQLEPQLTQRRAYRCVRLAEKVFALLVVVYGPKYQQSYDENRRPLPAVGWDGALSGRLVFEAKCRTPDEGDPRISVIEHYPEGVEPPKVAQRAEPKPAAPALAAQPQAPAAPGKVPDGEAPVPMRAPVGVVEQIGPDADRALAAEKAAAALEVEKAKARVEKEMAVAEGKAAPAAAPATSAQSAPAEAAPAQAAPAAAPTASMRGPAALPAAAPLPAPAPSQPARIAIAPTPAPASPPALAPVPVPAPAALPAAASQPLQTAALPPAQPRRFGDPDELPEPSDLEAPEPFMVPEEEAYFRHLGEAPAAAPSAGGMVAASAAPPASEARRPAAEAPVSPEAPAVLETPKAAAEAADAPLREAPAPLAKTGRFAPVMSGGWRHRAPVPPAKPWRERGSSEG